MDFFVAALIQKLNDCSSAHVLAKAVVELYQELRWRLVRQKLSDIGVGRMENLKFDALKRLS